MIELFDKLGLPQTTIVDQKVNKKEFSQNFSLNVNDRKILSQSINKITLTNLLNSQTIQINPYSDEEKDYSEIAILRVDISTHAKQKQIDNIIQNIPYHLIVFYTCDEQFSLALSPKRINKSDSSKLVITESHFSRWIDIDTTDEIELDFIKSLHIQNHPFTNLYAFYSSFIDKLIAFEASKYSGTLISNEHTKETLKLIQKLESDIIELKNIAKSESNFNDKVALNIELKKLNDKLKELKENL